MDELAMEFGPVDHCPVCLSTERSLVERAYCHGHLLTYKACSHCGLVRMDPRPSASSMDAFYASVYMTERDIEATRSKQRDYAYFMLSVLSANARLDRIKSVLDIGCGYGETLSVIGGALRQYGDAQLSGIEPSEAASRIAGEFCQIIGRTHSVLKDRPERFDLIVMSHVLEHMEDPVDAMRLIASKLTNDGVISLEVPNFFSHPSVDLAHTFLFTPKSLRNTLSAAGLRCIALHATDHASTARPLYLTAIIKAGSEAMQRESVADVTAHRQKVRPAIGWKQRLHNLLG